MKAIILPRIGFHDPRRAEDAGAMVDAAPKSQRKGGRKKWVAIRLQAGSVAGQ
jgi:hypothetical protein